MNIQNSTPDSARRIVTPLGAWALSLGCAVGWGAFMMPGNTFLPTAGPLGTVLGILIGALIMLIVGVNYSYMMRLYPEAGGAYSYVRSTFDSDHGFVTAWFLLLTYVAIVWANATALPLIGRFLLGNIFQFGPHYRLAGFDVYAGELLLSCGALALGCLLCSRGRAALLVQITFALLLCSGVMISALAVFGQVEGGLSSLAPAFSPARSPLFGVLTVVAMSPWAFVGFESISHSAPEFRFPVKRALPIMVFALLAGAAAYAALAVIGATCLPAGFETWPDYIAALDTLDVSEAAPVFHAVRTAMGPIGTPALVLTVLGGVVTGLVGNAVAASRLLCAMASDGMLPPALGKLDRRGMPKNAILLILAVSLVIPFLGRTAVGWIVDVTTVGAAIVYAYASACALKVARARKNRLVTATGFVGVAISMVFLLYYLIPNLLAVSALSHESYLILALWSVLGLVVFRSLLLRDEARRLGRSTIVLIVMLSLTMFTSLVWMRQAANTTTREAMNGIHEYDVREMMPERMHDPEKHQAADAYLDEQINKVNAAFTGNSIVQIAFVVLSMATLFNIYSIIHRREKQIEREKILAEESSRAKTSFLSNMSHEIRTPMNAIIGLDNIALKDPDLPPRTREQLEKIGDSARHLLGLINDILDMSRIESGRMVLKEEEFSFRSFLDQINVIINGQCVDKGLRYDCRIIGHVGDYYIGDELKLKQVIINILGNAVKFTEPGGSVTFTAEQTKRFEDYCVLRFVMQDTGIGMSKEYLPKIFEAFSQENSGAANRYGSTGLGMAITKNLVEMMNGNISVTSEKGVGTAFTVTVTLKYSDRRVCQEQACALPAGLRVMLVDDDEIALEHARLVLRDIGVEPDAFRRPEDALARLRSAWEQGRPYRIVMTDLRMPEMDGVGLIRDIRAFDGGKTAIILLTGYNWDDVEDTVCSLGVTSILSKPLFADSILREFQAILLNSGELQPDALTADAEAEGAEAVSLEGLRVLMAEDIELNAEILSDLLELEGVAAEHAENGRIAVEMFSAHEPGYYDAILMDMRMPVMDGLEATAAIRALDRPDAQTVPIIAMTANAFDEDVQRSLQAGLNAHLSKPVEPDRLYDTLRAIAAKRGR